ncbi:MAG: hypothetical protein JO193_01600, partial [Candidatus Eremiobacteraeota bacterium]|nr:hypothetical protein [Candidatus Eremiobacteraeota bacterium]
ETRAGDRHIEPLDLFEAIREEGGGLAADILRRAASMERVTSPVRK